MIFWAKTSAKDYKFPLNGEASPNLSRKKYLQFGPLIRNPDSLISSLNEPFTKIPLCDLVTIRVKLFEISPGTFSKIEKDLGKKCF